MLTKKEPRSKEYLNDRKNLESVGQQWTRRKTKFTGEGHEL
jgi:hypothetical protein